MHKLGLKLWSTNDYYIREALSLYDQGLYDYIELYSVPGSYGAYIDKWKKINIPFVIHAPHFLAGLNFSKADHLDMNLDLAGQALKFADALNANIVIFHPGIGGDIKETARQVNLIKDKRTTIENKPYFAMDKKYICNGSSPEEILFVVKECDVKFCLDVGHCFCAANAKNVDPMLYMKEFLRIKPIMAHLSDGYYRGIEDNHLHFGQGDFDIAKIFSELNKDLSVTIETDKDSKNDLNDFKKDILFLRDLWK